MTVETILANILPEIGLDVTGAQISSNDYDLRQIRTFMNAAGKEIAARAEWSRLSRELTVPGSVSEIALPADFGRLAEKGAVRLNKTGFHPVRKVIAPEQWGFLSGRPSVQPYYHLSGGKALFSPVLDSDGALVRYVSNQWVAGTTPGIPAPPEDYSRSEIKQNGDELLIPERLVEKGTIWRWKRQKGLPFDDFQAEFEADLIADFNADRGIA